MTIYSFGSYIRTISIDTFISLYVTSVPYVPTCGTTLNTQ